MTSPKKLIIPDGRWKDVRALVSLDAETIKTVGEALASKDAVTGAARPFEVVSRLTGLPNVVALQVANAVTNLASQRERYKITDEELLADLRAGLGTSFAEVTADRQSALLTLLHLREGFHLLEKAESLRDALLPHLIASRTLCDLRPVFGEKRAGVEGLLLVNYLVMDVHDPLANEYRRLIVQLSETELKTLSACLSEAMEKIATLKARFAGQTSLLT